MKKLFGAIIAVLLIMGQTSVSHGLEDYFYRPKPAPYVWGVPPQPFGAWEVVPYNLSGTWKLRVVDVQRSFCNSSVQKKRKVLNIEIVQEGEQLTIIILNGPDDQVLEGRTSNFLISAWDSDEDQVTVLLGKVSKKGNRINGHITFSDKHDCPEAEAGTSKFRARRVTIGGKYKPGQFKHQDGCWAMWVTTGKSLWALF
ncbi:MAG: hypothetical protein JRF37_03145 [Deltaproteobacteria bacterium]|nr:hypothetical protein [Deltaproteobacteria bacterium]